MSATDGPHQSEDPRRPHQREDPKKILLFVCVFSKILFAPNALVQGNLHTQSPRSLNQRTTLNPSTDSDHCWMSLDMTRNFLASCTGVTIKKKTSSWWGMLLLWKGLTYVRPFSNFFKFVRPLLVSLFCFLFAFFVSAPNLHDLLKASLASSKKASLASSQPQIRINIIIIRRNFLFFLNRTIFF